MGTVTVLESTPVSLLLKRAERAFLEGDEVAAGLFLDRVRALSHSSVSECLACAHVSETMGRLADALQDYERALALEPGNAQVHLRRARIFLELNRIGEAKKEIKSSIVAGLSPEDIRRKLGSLLTRLGPPSDLDPSELDRAFHHGRLRRKAIERFIELFRGRPGAYARQWFDPRESKCGYFPVLEPLTPEVVEAHLQGKITIGQYLLDCKAMVHFAALDLDIGKEALSRIHQDPAFRQRLAASMRGLMEKLDRISTQLGIPLVFERSGHKGVHAWCFFEGPVPAWAARTVLTALKDAVSPPPMGIHVEVFPKQVALSKKGYGNLIKLPLGVHRATGKKSVFLDRRGLPVPNSLDYLLQIQRIPQKTVMSLAERLEVKEKGRVVPMPERKASKADNSASLAPAKGQSMLGQDAKEAYKVILERCALIRYLVRKARDFRHLSFDERKIVLGVLGHLPEGPKLVHHVISRCADYDPQITGHFISRMPASPLGCRTIRRRLFYLETARCRCEFSIHGKEYPTPLLHVFPKGGFE